MTVDAEHRLGFYSAYVCHEIAMHRPVDCLNVTYIDDRHADYGLGPVRLGERGAVERALLELPPEFLNDLMEEYFDSQPSL